MSPAPSVNRILNTTWLIVFATSLCFRAVDPAIPQIAGGFAMDPATVALLATAFALPYALTQPILGALADAAGKTPTMTICILLSALAAFAGAFVLDFQLLAATRALAGIVNGGLFPIALAIVGDLVPVEQRQVAMSRILAAAMLGNLLGSPFAGLIGDLAGWRAIFIAMGLVSLVALAAALVGFRHVPPRAPGGFSAALVLGNYRGILRHPLAKVCYGAVFLEGVFLFGLFPHMADLMRANGEPRALIAGVVLAGFGLGGIGYWLAVSAMLRRYGERKLMFAGGVCMAFALGCVALRPPWPLQFIDFALMGFGFYMLHGVIQIYAIELSSAARGSAAALHSMFLFIGLAVGPVYYRFALASAGLTATLAISAAAIVAVAVLCATMLRRDAGARG
ncbi:MAG: MFS transporter [Proteobacteria bacterium]|nr:MFS transporter [Pseudomonadota bacterium]